MHIVNQIDPGLHARARQKQLELWDRIIAAVSGEWERGWTRQWKVNPRIQLDEVMEDLEYGQG